jgi:hypothetical protein
MLGKKVKNRLTGLPRGAHPTEPTLAPGRSRARAEHSVRMRSKAASLLISRSSFIQPFRTSLEP